LHVYGTGSAIFAVTSTRQPMRIQQVLLFLFLLALAACSGSNEPRIKTFPNKFADQELVKIHDLKDRRLSEALFIYLEHSQASYREEAALAFASLQDSAALPLLYRLLSDPDVLVRKAAAFAIGQTKSKSSQSVLANQLTLEPEPLVRFHLLEALGKCLDGQFLYFLIQYEASDAATLSGKAWGIYRAGLTGLKDTVLTNAAGRLLNDSLHAGVRLAASHYFSRMRGISIDDWEPTLKKLAAQDPLPEVRMATARALGKSTSDSIAFFLRDQLLAETDPMVKVNLIRSIQSDHLEVLQETIGLLLKDVNYHISVAVGEQISIFEGRNFYDFLWSENSSIPIVRTRALVLGKLLETSNYSYNAYRELMGIFEQSSSAYEKGFALQALSRYHNASSFLGEQLNHTHPFVRTSAMEALSAMNQATTFPSYKQTELINYYKRAVVSGDAGQVTVASSTLAQLKDRLRPYFSNLDFMRQGLDSLEVPEDLEPYQALENTLRLYEGKTADAPSQLYQNPIEWGVVKGISKTSSAIVETTKGKIEITLLVEEAPGSVENFVSLARANFYNNIIFHRVVPNFVAQAGCPRGDGYGSSDGVIRSEFSTHLYGTGYVGMASAGKDTEGSQWFITHSHAPHLDGGYTIFGRVVNGMAVVKELEVGDSIISVTIP